MEKEKKHLSLGKLFSSLGRKQAEQEEPEREAPAAEPVPVPDPEDDPALLCISEGSLLNLWQRWAGADAPPPILSLAGDSGEEPVHLMGGDQGLTRERVRLKAQLEQDAKLRLRAIAEQEEKDGPPLDAACKVYTSRYGMAAWAILFPPSGPEGRLQVDMIGKALQESGVTTGVDSTAVLSLIQETAYFKLVAIARGTPAVEGEDGRIIEHLLREIPQEVKVDENGLADYRSLNYVRMIEKDEVICDIIPPTPGTPGVRVDGKVIEPKPVKAAKPPAGTNTTITDDGLHLVASRVGHLEFANGAFHVKPVLEVKGDVDYGVGNIDFRGDVHIHGDVRENFVVRATGTVTIDGLVEAANVEAGGDLVIACGVLGDNRALIKSGGCIRAKYLESCVAYAGKCIYADCAMSSQIFSDDSIHITSGRGTIIGGALTAAAAVKARMIGSQSGRKTEITLGVLPYVQEKLSNDESGLEIIRKEMEELSKQLNYLEANQGLEGSSEKLAKLHLRKSVLAMKESQLLKRRERLEPMTPDLSKCRLECDIVYPFTRVTIQDAVWRADQVRHRCRIAYNTQTGEIREL